MSTPKNRRILLIDDNQSIHDDFSKILLPEEDKSANLADMRAAFLSGGAPTPEPEESKAENEKIVFEIASALQGEDGYNMLCDACDKGEPYAMAFVDMRMPPGWDGVQTIAKLWERDPELQVVVCTAFSDYTWEETIAELGQSDRLLILKKPFDAIEIYQLAAALTEKWNSSRREHLLLEDVRKAELEARAYASSLETVNRSLMTAKAAADMAASLKTEFLVQLTNEVSSKLGAVLGNVQLLAVPENASSEDRDKVESMLDIGNHLMQTITEILHVTTLEAGKGEVEVEECDPCAVAQSVLDEYREAATGKGISLELQATDSVPACVQSEERHLRKLLDTLVDNAIKYTDSGSISVRASIASTDSWKRPRLVFEVEDSGRGIPRERLGTIFEPSARSEQHSELGGYGFGLALAKRLAAILGGTLTVRSEPGQGSCFRLDLEVGLVTASKAA